MKNNYPTKGQTLNELVEKYELERRAGENCYYEPEAYIHLITHFEEKKAYSQAMAVAIQAANQHPYTIDFLIRQANLTLFLDQPEQGLMILDKADKIAPGNIEVLLQRVWVLAELKVFNQSLDILSGLKQVISTIGHKEMSLIYFYEALVLEKMENLEDMYEALKKAIELDSENEEALRKMWLCVERTGKHKESVEIHKVVVSENPFSHWGWFNLANAYEYLCEYNKAIEAYEFVMALNQNFEYAYRNCAEVCFNVKQYEKALKYYTEVHDNFDQDADLLLQLAKAHFELGHHITAKNLLDKALQEDDLNDEILYYLGKCSFEDNKWKAAIDYYNQAIEYNPEAEEYYAGLAQVYKSIKDFEKAEMYFKEATEIGIEFAKYWTELANLYLETGRPHAALETLEDARQVVFEQDALDYFKVIVLLSIDKRDSALELLHQTLEDNFSNHTLLFDWKPEIFEDEKLMAAIDYFEKSYHSI